MELRNLTLPNWGIYQIDLDQPEIDHLYKIIANYSPKGYKFEGNKIISIDPDVKTHAWGLFDDGNVFQEKVLNQAVTKYFQEYGIPWWPNGTHSHVFTFQRFWCNVTTTGQYQAAHNHDSVLSFVIWLNIPHDTDEEKLIMDGMHPEAGDFLFMYTDMLGKIRRKNIHLNKSYSGTMMLFPSEIHHAVYPHFSTNEPRISLSGDVSMDSLTNYGAMNNACSIHDPKLKRFTDFNSQERMVRDPMFEFLSSEEKDVLFRSFFESESHQHT